MKVKCPECNGYGKVMRERYNTIATKNCPLCKGDGMVEVEKLLHNPDGSYCEWEEIKAGKK